MKLFADKVFQSRLRLICLILLLGVVAHAAMLPAPFKTLDDISSIINNPDIKNFSSIGKVFRSSFFGGRHYYRPLVSLSFMVEHHFFGLNPFYYNLTNLLLHVAIAVLVFLVMDMVLESRGAAVGAGVLFAVHPIHWEAVGNIPGRAVILSVLFTLLAFYYFCLARRRPEKCDSRMPTVFLYGLSVLFFVSGLLAKESAAMLPVVLLAYLFLVEKRPRQMGVILPYIGVAALYVVARRAMGMAETFPWRSLEEYTLGFVTFLRAGLTFIRLFVWPADLHFDRSQALFLSFREGELWATVIAWAAAGAALVKFRRRVSAKVFFFLAWFVIELAPVSQLVTTIGVGPGYISAAEHFLYMPSVAMLALMALGGREVFRFNRRLGMISEGALFAIAGGVVAALMMVSVHQGLIARSPIRMFDQTLEQDPNNARILNSMGLELAHLKHYAQAEVYFRRAVEREPLNIAYRLSWGRSLCDLGRLTEGIAVYETIADAGPFTDMLKRNTDEAYRQSEKGYEQLIEREPDNARAYYSLGTIYSRTGRIAESLAQYHRARELDPTLKSATFNLAASYAILGRSQDAVGYYRMVINSPGPKDQLDVQSLDELARLYQGMNDSSQAALYRGMADQLRKELKSKK